MNKIITRICVLAMLALPGKGVVASFVPGCYAVVADTAFVRDTARVVSTRLSAGTLVVDTTLIVSTTYVVDTVAGTIARAAVPQVSDSLAVRSVADRVYPIPALSSGPTVLPSPCNSPLRPRGGR